MEKWEVGKRTMFERLMLACVAVIICSITLTVATASVMVVRQAVITVTHP